MRTAHSITSAVAMAAPTEIVWWETIDGDALISRTRSQLATKFLTEPRLADADVMVIIDDDVQFQPSDLWRIVQGCRDTGDLFGGVYVTRERSPHAASLAFPGTRFEFGATEESRPKEIRYLATGFMAIPRKALHDIIEHPGFDTVHGPQRVEYCTMGTGRFPMWDFFRPFLNREESGAVHYLSEDWAFCERARQAGYKVWADQSIILGHRAVVSITVADLGDTGHALTEKGAASKGVSILVTQPEKGPEAGQAIDLSSTTRLAERPERAIKSLRSATDALNEAGVRYWLACGTALGAVRDGAVIPWDSDIDIAVDEGTDPATVHRAMIDKGFTLARRFSGLEPWGYEATYARDGVPVDVFWSHRENGRLSHKLYGVKTLYYDYDARLFDELQRVAFDGVRAYVPSPPEQYLEAHYGPDWKTPREEWDWRTDPKCVRP